ncbi:glycosyltransferase family 69 protein [Acephala macrosclerotiorum]|nr:glycosyltransferase family 69 protein [Acephala macrosclerotiorum]
MNVGAQGLKFIRVAFSHVVLILRHHSRRFRALWLFVSVLVLLEAFFTVSIYSPSKRSLAGSPGVEVSHALQQHLYIAALHYNDEELLQKHWIPALLKLVEHWKPENIYVSISESGSWDGTKNALTDLGHELGRLGVEYNIQTSNTTHENLVNREPSPNEPGWIWTPRGKLEMRRLPYLAAERNKAMAMLKELAHRPDKHPRTFDKVLWLNDVIFNTDQVTALINTHHGDYAATCSMDFLDPPQSPIFYDTFAIRDHAGQAALSQHWPWFSASESRKAVKSYSPVPVRSCWNGMVVFDAAPFYNDPPLQFRGIPDTLADKHLEGSECCLIHADNPLVRDKGVWLNPNVRVSYNEAADKIVNPEEGGWPSASGKVQGIWANRWAYWTGWPWRWGAEKKVERKLKEWEVGERKDGEAERHEPGKICLVDETQILLSNGWMHI